MYQTWTSCSKLGPHVPNLDLMFQTWNLCSKLGHYVPNLDLMYQTWNSCSKLKTHVPNLKLMFQTWTSTCTKLGPHVPNLNLMFQILNGKNDPHRINSKCSLKLVDWSVNKTRLRGVQSAVCSLHTRLYRSEFRLLNTNITSNKRFATL